MDGVAEKVPDPFDLMDDERALADRLDGRLRDPGDVARKTDLQSVLADLRNGLSENRGDPADAMESESLLSDAWKCGVGGPDLADTDLPLGTLTPTGEFRDALKRDVLGSRHGAKQVR